MNDDLLKIINESNLNNIQQELKKLFLMSEKSNFSLSENDLNDILKLVLNRMHKNHVNEEVNKIKVELLTSKAMLYIEKSMFKFMTVLYSIELIPYIKNNQLVFQINKINLGSINISKESAAKSLQNFNSEFIKVDEENMCIICNVDMPKNISLKTIRIKDKKIEIEW